MAGSAAAGSVGAALGYRMAGSQLLNDSLAEMEKESQTQRGRGLSAEERNRAVEALTPIAQDTGLWEAGPEFVGNAMMFGLGRVALGFLPKQSMAKLAQTALGRAGVRAAAGAGALGTEIGTEGITQFNQGPNQQRADAATQAILDGKDPQAAIAAVEPMYQGVEGLWQATKDVAPATIATVLMMGGIAKPVHMAGAAIENRRAGNARVDQAEQDTAALRANLDVANEQDIAQALSGFDQLETQGLPNHAAARLEQARQQLTRELELRASPESLAEPLETARGRAGYLGLAERADSLSDEQLLQAASRPLPQDVAPEIAKAHKIYGAELAKRQQMAQVADHLQDPDAAKIMSSTLGRITSGKPLAQGGYGSRDFNLASLSDDMLERYRLAADVLGQSDTASNSVQTARDALNQEAERRASGQRTDPECIRLSETAVKVALAPEAKMAAMLKGLSTEGLDRIAGRLNELATANPLLADRARTVLEQVRQARMQQFNPSGTQQAGITAAMQGWNQDQGRPAQPAPGLPGPAEQGQQPPITPNIPNPAATGQPMLADALQRQQALKQEVAGLNQQPTPSLPAPPQWGGPLGTTELQTQAAPTVGPAFAPQPLSGPAELTRLLGTNPPAPTLPTPAPPQGPTSLADLLGRDSRLDVVPPSVSAQGAVAPPAPTPRLPSLPNVQTSQTAQQAAPPVVVPTGPEGARGARAEGTGSEPGAAASEGRAEVTPDQPVKIEPAAKNISFDVIVNKKVTRVHDARIVDLKLPEIVGDELFAVHPAFEKEGGFVVSHVATGARIGSPSTTPEGAIEYAKTLLQRAGKQRFEEGVHRVAKKSKKLGLRNEIPGASSAPTPAPEPNEKVTRGKRAWEMTRDEWLAATRFYRSGKDKMAETPTGERIILKREATEKTFRETSADFLNKVRGGQIRDALAKGKPVPAEVLSEYPDLASAVRGGPTGRDSTPTTATPSQPETTREKGKTEAAPLLNQEQPSASTGAVKSDKPTAPTQKVVTAAGKPAPTWNEANSSQRAQILKDTGASDEFAQRKANEWTTWDAIPEGPIKKRIRDVLEDRASQDNAGKETTPAPKTIETPAGPAKATPGGPGTIAIELPVGATAATPATEAYGKANKIFTEDAAAKARELLKRKLGQLNTGLDPEMIQAGITLAGYHIEAGARAFAAYSKAMIADLGEAARPFLRSWYEGVRYYPGFDANGMSSAKEIDALAEREADTKTEIKSDQAPPTKTTGSRALADLIKTFLRETSGNLTIPQFWGMANKAFGGSQAQGTYNSKDAYDAMELGLNLAVLADENAPLRGQDSDQVRSAIGYLEALQNRLPTQTKRDDEQQKMQQFSTPHTHAHIVAWAAGIGRNDVVLEPTAGTGNLVAHAKLFGPRSVVANELSERRDALLRQIPGVRVFNENANHLNAVLPADVKPTVVVMNPPFSADVNLPGKKDLELGATHIEQALARLQPGGRLVAIVGRGMAMDAPRFKKWWNDIEKRYNVRANIAISGKEYTKFGTSFDNRILVIDKTGQTGLRSNIVQGEVSRVEELVDRLGGVRRERVEQQNAAGATSQTGVDRTENQSGAGQSVSAATDQEGVGGSGTVPGVAAGSGRPAGRAGPSGRNAGTGARTDNSGAGANRGRGVRSDRPEPDAGGVDSGTGVPAENQPERTGRAAQEVGELETSGAMGPTDAEGFGTSAFESYRPTTSFKSAKPHPTPLSESAAMGSVKCPSRNYSPKLPADVVNEGRLSAAQLETVAYAGQAHEQILPNGERRGFFVGDGTGVGKGAQIAGIILDNWNRGRKKAVWISENSPLFADAQRDAEWVGLGKDRLLLQGKIKGEISAKEGVLFTTYSTLTNSEKDKDGKPGAKRIDQIITWLGKDFDGVIAFDEAHSMSNALQSKGSRGTVKPSQTALAGIELQKALPKARVVYVSATGATELRNLVYASRLGLWGEGTAFGSAIDFVSDINGGGLAAMEVVAKDMKAMGSYTARSLSYDGVEVEQLAHELSPEQAKTYDELARAWQITLANVDAAMEASGSKKDSQARSSALSAFWGAHQRFFNAVLTALSAPSLLADAKRQLDAGQSVIMQLVNTDEATMKRRLAQASDTGQTLEELDLTPRDVLMQYLQHSFPTTLYEPYIDDNGHEGVRTVVDASGNVVQDPDAIARRDRLLESIATLKVPESILDQIINHFGSDSVAEITGRSRRIVRQQDGTAKMEKLGEAKRRGDAADFDNGKRRILVFSDAGGTGRSYHADLRIPNQQKRVHYLVQPGWRADKAIQGLGRSHRTNQAQPPLFKTVTTTIKSQARFVSSIARRMNQMGALTKGQRDATSGQGMFDDDMNLENEYSQQALVSLFHAIAAGEVQGVTVSDIEQQMGVRFIDPKTGQILRDKIPNIQRFLNRLLSLDIAMMDRVFDEFDTRRRNNIEYAKQQGFYDQGMETLRAISVKKDEDVVAITHPGGSTTRYVKLTVTHESKLLPFDSLHPDAFFARNKSSGKLYAFEPAKPITNP